MFSITFRKFGLFTAVFFSHVLVVHSEHLNLPLKTAHSFIAPTANSKWHLEEIDGGLTNQNYILASGPKSYFMRVASDGNSSLGIALEKEFACTKAAAKIAVGPDVILYAPKQKVLITQFIPSTKKKIDLHEKNSLIEIADKIKTLHTSSIKFPSSFSPFRCIDTYYDKACKLDASIPQLFEEQVLPFLKKIENCISLKESTPCHLDLHAGNVIDDGTRFWIIDWEYAAMADPFFDLACFASTEQFTDEEMNQLLTHYLNDPTDHDKNHLYLMRIVADARWAVWCYLQSKNSKVDYDYLTYGDQYLKACLSRLPLVAKT